MLFRSPNPVTDKLTISNKKSGENTIEIFNILNQRIFFKQSAADSQHQEIHIDVSDFPSGIYFLKSGNYSAKFVKQ